MQAMFPDIEIWGESKDALDCSLGGMIHRFTKSWWNAEYTESIPKNDLGVDCISRESYEHEYFLRKEFELKIDELYLLRKKFDELQRQFEEQAVKAESILNKIRAEIVSIDTELMIPLDRVLKVLDKYKAESER